MPAQIHSKDIFHEQKVCVIIPTYNNDSTILQVIDEVIAYCKDVIVINDGSTDQTSEMLSERTDIDLITFHTNKGKGFAIRQGFKRAGQLNFQYAITFDADGQHYAEDLQTFADKLIEEPFTLMIGSRNISEDGMPAKNTFANKFSNFWFWVETGDKLPDTQSGFRMYPILFYKNSKFFTNNYEFEVEVLVRSAWSGIKIIPVPISVRYPEDRVTHFRPLPDFGRISILNTILVLITFLYIIPRNVFLYFKRNRLTSIVKEQLWAHNESPFKVSAAMGFGVFMGMAPIWGFQMIVAAFLAHFMRLNKILVLAASNISIPPLVPFIIYFSYKTGGLVLNTKNEITKETLVQLKNQVMEGNFYVAFEELGYSIFQYIIGAFIFGLGMGLLVGIVAYIILLVARAIHK